MTPGSAVQYLESHFFARGESDYMWPRFWGLSGVLLIYGFAAAVLRWWVLASADQLLGRVRDCGAVVSDRGEGGSAVEVKPAVG